MQPESSPNSHLRRQLAAAAKHLHDSASVVSLPVNRLKHYAHELAFGPDPQAEKAAIPIPQIDAVAWAIQTQLEPGVFQTRRHYLVMTLKPDPAPRWFERVLEAAAKMRSHLSADDQSDVAILIVAEAGALKQGKARTLERNESLGQVFVWEVGTDPAGWGDEAGQFVARLFLGPIHVEAGGAAADLSPIDAIFGAGGPEPGLVGLWRGVLMEAGIDDAVRAERLLRAYAELRGPSDGE